MDRWEQIKKIFKEGLQRTAEERPAFLEEACGSDAALRKEVEALLSASQGEDDGFLDPPTEGVLKGHGDRLVGKQLGQYKLERLISAGGMGTVYEGRQEHPSRTVAVKVMREGIASRSALRRFEYEAEILAHLSHPNIAQVFEAGTHGGEGPDQTGGVPYFVMEYIPNARAITEYAKEKDFSIQQRLALFLPVCDAVNHGHQKGIIHRDLKPTNILVDDRGQVKIIDFGVARATDSDIAVTTQQTDVGQLLGTVQYMSPEQCKADSRDLDIRSDVYALGVVLYELLSGELPYNVRRIAVFEATRIICETEPKRPSTTLRGLKGDIETILLKALEKERTRRYQSVIDFAADIERYLGGDVIHARPAGPATRAWKRVKRNPVVSASIAFALIVLLVAALYVILWAYPQVLMERNKALEARNEADLQREAAVNAQAEAEKEVQRTRTVNDFLEEMLSMPDPGQEGRDVKIVEALEKAVERVDEEFSDLPEIEASLRNTIGWTYYGLGRYNEAEEQLSCAVELSQDTLGKENEETVDYMYNLTEVVKKQGRFPDAESLAREILEIRERLLGKEHIKTLRSLSMLASVYHLQGKYSEAEQIINDVLEKQRRTLGEDHEDIIFSTNVLAGLCQATGRFSEAEGHMRKVLDARRLLHGEEHPSTMAAKKNLANTLSGQGKYDDAEILYREILEAEIRVLGEEHPHTLTSMYNLASVLLLAGKFEEAEAFQRDTAEARRRVLGDKHPDTLSTLRGLAQIKRRRGEYKEAESILREIGTTCQEVLGGEHPDTLWTLVALALTLKERGDYEEAESILRETSASFRKVLGDKHPDTLNCMDAFAITLTIQKKYSEAETQLRKVYEIRRSTFGDEHRETHASMHNLAALYEMSGDYEKSESMHRELLEIRRRVRGEEHPETVKSKYHLAKVLVEQSKYHEAESLYRDVLTFRRSFYGESHVFTLSALNGLAEVLLNQGFHSEVERMLEEAFEIVALYYPEENIHEALFSATYGKLLFQQERYEEAERYLRKAFEIFSDIRGEDSPQAQYVIGLLVDLYEAWGKPEEAEAW
ncbi:MAG: tetratricopeptide repeat protein [Planctomycetota bacterium]|jgi:serine/threonine protein kinase